MTTVWLVLLAAVALVVGLVALGLLGMLVAFLMDKFLGLLDRWSER